MGCIILWYEDIMRRIDAGRKLWTNAEQTVAMGVVVAKYKTAAAGRGA